MGRRRACWVLAVVLCCVPRAHAEAPKGAPVVAQKPRDFALELSLVGHAGGQLSRYEDDAVQIGGTALARTGLLEGGFQLNMVSPPLFATGVLAPALVGGLGWQTDLGLRLDLLGVLGADFYSAPGKLLTDDPGTSATLAFGGARAGIAYRFGARGNGHAIVGLFASYEQNFQRVTRRYSYYQNSWFSDDSSLTYAQHTFGDRRLAIALSLGLTFDLMPR